MSLSLFPFFLLFSFSFLFFISFLLDSLEDTKRCLIWRRNLEVFLNDNQSNWIEIIQQNNINYESLKNEFYSKNGLLSNENNIDHNKLFTCEVEDIFLLSYYLFTYYSYYSNSGYYFRD